MLPIAQNYSRQATTSDESSDKILMGGKDSYLDQTDSPQVMPYRFRDYEPGESKVDGKLPPTSSSDTRHRIGSRPTG